MSLFTCLQGYSSMHPTLCIASKARTSCTLKPVSTIYSLLHECKVSLFRDEAFDPELPVLISASREASSERGISPALPAFGKWFQRLEKRGGESWELNQHYFKAYEDTWLPYEYTLPKLANTRGRNQTPADSPDSISPLSSHNLFALYLREQNSDALRRTPLATTISENHNELQFASFHAPLSLFLHAAKWRSESPSYNLPNLYIAQAQIRDLPNGLREDVPAPHLVMKAGKGDIYDANIWIGTPNTYTPLHKDPNPNLFVQLAGSKIVRLYNVADGRALFQDVKRQLMSPQLLNGDHEQRRDLSMSIRGEEMMQGLEKKLFHEAVWGAGEGDSADTAYEVTVAPGDALFIPKGWMHSIKSFGNDLTASVNWWFR